MKISREIESEIIRIKTSCKQVLTGSLATVDINAPRALMQITAEAKLRTLYWVLDKEFKSTLKGTNT